MTGKCKQCGCEYVLTVGRSEYCPDCRVQRTKERNRRSAKLSEQRRMDATRLPRELRGRVTTVVYDPTPLEEGGFAPGATFPWSEMAQMARENMILEGFIVKDCHRHYVCVKGKFTPTEARQAEPIKPYSRSKLLTMETIAEIRQQRSAGAELKDLAEEFGISASYVSRICLRRKV